MIRTLIRKIVFAVIGGLTGFLLGVSAIATLMADDAGRLSTERQQAACEATASETYQQQLRSVEDQLAYWQSRYAANIGAATGTGSAGPGAGPDTEVSRSQVQALSKKLAELQQQGPVACTVTASDDASFIARVTAVQDLMVHGPGQILTWPLLFLTTFAGVTLPLIPRRPSAYDATVQAESAWWHQADQTPVARLDDQARRPVDS